MDLGFGIQKITVGTRIRNLKITRVPILQTTLTLLAPKNGFRVRNSENLCWNKKWHRQDVMHANFQEKRTTNLLYYEY